MKKDDVQKKIIDKISPYKMEFEACYNCGNETFFVVFTAFRQVKPRFGPKGFDLSTDVDFYCSRCGEMASGVGYNEDLVNMKSREKKMKTPEDLIDYIEDRRRQRTQKSMLKESP